MTIHTPPDEPPHAMKLLKRRIGCENKLLRVYLDHIVSNDGVEIEDFMVVAPKMTSAGGIGVTGVGILPIADGKVGLLPNYRHALEATQWEIPRGFVNADEPARNAASRELVEETGLRCEPENLRSLGFVCQEGGILAARTELFAAENCARGQRTDWREPGLGQLQFFSNGELRDMARESVVQDACTLVAWYRYITV